MSKHFFLSLIVHFSVALAGCARRPTGPPTAEVEYLGPTEPGTTYVQARGCATGGVAATTQEALRVAFETMLYRGIPGSEVNTPLIADEATARQRFASYWQTFYGGGRSRTFLALISPVPNGPGSPRGCGVVRIKINHAALRQELEQQGIVRRFGY